MKYLVSILFLFVCITGFSQSANFQAQGYYYKAKELYEAGSYSDAITYVQKAKTVLNGTNFHLQYLHILALQKAKNYIEANKELKTFFDLQDNKIANISFDKNVDQLTDDETKMLTKIMVDIQENASKQAKGLEGFTESETIEYINNLLKVSRGAFIRNNENIQEQVLTESNFTYNKSVNNDDCIIRYTYKNGISWQLLTGASPGAVVGNITCLDVSFSSRITYVGKTSCSQYDFNGGGSNFTLYVITSRVDEVRKALFHLREMDKK